MIYLRWFEASRMARLAEDWGCSKIKLANIDREIPITPHRMGHPHPDFVKGRYELQMSLKLTDKLTKNGVFTHG